MTCSEARETISALIDNEDPPASYSALGTHLSGCNACQDWQAAAFRLARRSRLAAAGGEPGPETAWKERVLASAPKRLLPPGALRTALGAVAVAQVVLTVHFLFQGRSDAVHDQGALDIAIGIGLAAAAWRPWRAAGLQALVGTAALLLIGMESIDLVRGGGELSDMLRHAVVRAGWLLIRALARAVPPVPGADSKSWAELHLIRHRKALGGRRGGWRQAVVSSTDPLWTARHEERVAA